MKKKFDFNGMFSSPWALWAISITLSVVMWVYVTGMDEAERVTRKFSCPIEYRGLASQAILRGKLSEVDLEIRGTEQAITHLNYDSVKAYVDARNLLPGKRYTVNVNVEYPETITLISCFPSQATLDIVRQVTRLMTVETILPSNIPEGYYIEGVTITPKDVGVKGAEDDLAKVGSVRVTPSIEELQRGGELLMPVKFNQSEPFEGSVTIEPAQVRFSGSLVRGLPKKRVPVSARIAGRVASDYAVKSVVVDPSEVQVEGNAEDLAKIETIDTEIIDISMMDSDSVIVAPLKHPDAEGVLIPGVSSVRVIISLGEARAEKMIMNVPVELRGTERPQSWISSPPNVSVAVEGKPSKISGFGANVAGLKVYADMSNIFMAPVTLPLKAEIMSGDKIRVVRIEPSNVTVNKIDGE